MRYARARHSAATTLLALALAVGVGGACSDGVVDVDEPDAPASAVGTFKGPYTSTRHPGTHEATIVLTQAGRTVAGTFLPNSTNTTSNVTGEVTGTRIEATFGSGGTCPSTTTAVIDIIQSGATLIGTYTTVDCVGQYTGAFTLNKQT